MSKYDVRYYKYTSVKKNKTITKWRVDFAYKTPDGVYHKSCKRGFDKKDDAKIWVQDELPTLIAEKEQDKAPAPPPAPVLPCKPDAEEAEFVESTEPPSILAQAGFDMSAPAPTEVADPVVGVGYTSGLVGLPNEIKLKFLADNDFANLSGEALADAIRERIRQKSSDLKGDMTSEGTTPRRLTDLIGSLCDLTSGSGDKGTPIVVVQNYFNNYAN